MTPAQAHALTNPPTPIGTAAAAAYEALRRTSEEVLNSKVIQPGGRGKTSTSMALIAEWALRHPGVQLNDTSIRPGGNGETVTDAPALARLLAGSDTPRPLLIDTDPPRSLDWPGPALTHAFPVDLPWPADGHPFPVDPDLADEILKELGITPNPQTE